MATIELGGISLRPDLSGALVWDDEKTIIVADLHFEKAASFARRGQPLPPYDTATTLTHLSDLLARTSPSRIICLGDSFHDAIAAMNMPDIYRIRLRDLMRDREWIWVTGNHDREIPAVLGGRCVDAVVLGPITFRHEALRSPAGLEVSGHFHPKATVMTRGRAVTRPCFIFDERRIILPAFGAYTGGLNIKDAAITAQFGATFRVAMLGQRKLHWFSSTATV